jgi:hypothetical protein
MVTKYIRIVTCTRTLKDVPFWLSGGPRESQAALLMPGGLAVVINGGTLDFVSFSAV